MSKCFSSPDRPLVPKVKEPVWGTAGILSNYPFRLLDKFCLFSQGIPGAKFLFLLVFQKVLRAARSPLTIMGNQVICGVTLCLLRAGESWGWGANSCPKGATLQI